MLRAADLIVLARRSAGVSQAELARRLHRPQSTIARWELGEMEPQFAAVMHVLAACGVEAVLQLAAPDASYLGHVDDQLRLLPGERLQRLGGDGYVTAVKALAEAAPAAVLTGDVAGALVGGPLVLPRREVVVELCARSADRPAIAAAAIDAGVIADIVDLPAGTRGYGDLRRQAIAVDVDGVEVAVAAPLDLLRIALAADRAVQALALEAVVEYGRRHPEGPPAQRQYTDSQAVAAIETWLATQ